MAENATTQLSWALGEALAIACVQGAGVEEGRRSRFHFTAPAVIGRHRMVTIPARFVQTARVRSLTALSAAGAGDTAAHRATAGRSGTA
ncbi:hypothetical protein [Devosia sp.]|uniref:hypothetical protein n=1 Tax=Devosia sp. TaxID=1871048 RepID=UPI003A8EDA17